MRSALANAGNTLSSALRRMPQELRALLVTLWTQPIARRRFAVVIAGVFVCCYALAVLGYVFVTPEIGVRCAFTPAVDHFDSHFLYPRKQEPLRDGDVIKTVGDRQVHNWSQLMRKI